MNDVFYIIRDDDFIETPLSDIIDGEIVVYFGDGYGDDMFVFSVMVYGKLVYIDKTNEPSELHNIYINQLLRLDRIIKIKKLLKNGK